VWRLPDGGQRPWDYRKQQNWCTPITAWQFADYSSKEAQRIAPYHR
jgi:hypothetical protein